MTGLRTVLPEWPAAAALLAAVATWIAMSPSGASSDRSDAASHRRVLRRQGRWTPRPTSTPWKAQTRSTTQTPWTPWTHPTPWTLWTPWTSGRQAARAREAVTELLLAVAAELRAGRLPEAALRAAAETLLEDGRPVPWFSAPAYPSGSERPDDGGSPSARVRRDAAGDVARAVRRAAESDDVPAGLRSLALPGADGLRQAAAGWELAGATGCELAPVLDRIAAGLRADEALRRRTAAALAGPRTTAWLLAGLPVVTVLMGSVAGARPLAVLGSPVGALCVGLGLPLTTAGLLWNRALARRAVRGLAR